MLTIAICDNDEATRLLLQEYLQTLVAENISFSCKSFKSGLALTEYYRQGKRCDLIILNVMMRGRDGITTAQFVRKYDPRVPIMAMGYSEEYAVQCYDVGACCYLLKPLEKQRFLTIVRSSIAGLVEEERGYYGFRNKQGWHKVKLSHILYFESNLRKIKLRTLQTSHIFSTAISKVEKKLKSHYFVRVHKSYLVNLAHVIRVGRESMLLENKEVIPVSKHKKKILKERFLAFIAENLST